MKHTLLIFLIIAIFLVIPSATRSASLSYYPYSISYIEKIQPAGYFILYIKTNTNPYNPDIEKILVFRTNKHPIYKPERKLIAEILPAGTRDLIITDKNVEKRKTYYYFLKTQLKNNKIIGYTLPLSTKKATVVYQKAEKPQASNVVPGRNIAPERSIILERSAAPVNIASEINVVVPETEWQKAFNLVCDEPCEIEEKSLDDFKKLAWLSYSQFKNLLDTDVVESIKPIEIHMEAKGPCVNTQTAMAMIKNGKGFICFKLLPFIEKNGKKVLNIDLIRRDEPLSVFVHELIHLVLWNFDVGKNGVGESLAQNIGHFVQNPAMNGNYCDSKWNSGASYPRFMYDLCQQTGFNAQHLKQFFAILENQRAGSLNAQINFVQIINAITGKDVSLLIRDFQF